MSSRKASDVLLSLERKVDTLLGYYRNQDLLIKTLINKLNGIESTASVAPPAPQVKQPTVSKPIMPGLKPGIVLQGGVLKRAPEEISETEEEQFTNVEQEEEIITETKPVGHRRTARYVSNNQENVQRKSIPVHQKILYPDGKNVCLANVEIFDSNAKLVKQLRTNASGKWVAALDPGIYSVNITKSPAANKSAIDMSFEIEIPVSDKPVELPVPSY